MRVAGAWVGLGLGDTSDEIRRLKAHLRRKFIYAAGLSDSPLFDAATVTVVAEMQKRYAESGRLRPGSYTPGIVNAETKIVCGFIARPMPPDRRGVLLTVCGTGVPWWVGPDADTARAVEGTWLWQPIGYPARAVPMGESIAAGRAELSAQILKHRDRILANGCALAGYSQGALVVSELWEFGIKPDDAPLHWVAGKVRKAVTWGNPMRERGSVSPDAGGAPSPPGNQGVTEKLMVNTPSWWRNYAHAGDLYTDCPPDESGENRTAIWKVIRDGDVLSGPDSLLRQVLELTGVTKDSSQISEATGAAKAMIDAVLFFGKQTGPHINYSVAEAIQYLKEP